MSDWVGDKVSMMQRRHPRANMLDIAARMAKAEHQRAVRIVKREMPDSWLHPYLTGPKALLPPIGYPITPKQVENLLQALKRDLLAALERGRTKRKGMK